MVSINYVLGSKERMNQANNDAQVRAANAGAAGQVGAANAGAAGNVLGTIWSQPANFGNTMGNVYGNMAGTVGQQGGNYADSYGNFQAGMGSLGNNAANNYASYSQGLQGLAAGQDPYAANSAAEAARQVAIGNIGSGALGAYGSAMNSALGAYGLQQQAYNLAMGQAIGGNQSALSALGQSRNNALSNLGNAYAALGGTAAQLGGAGLGASQFSQIDTSSDQFARNRQQTDATSSDYANMYGDGGGGYGGGGFNASGPGGTIASGSYGGYGGGGYGMGGWRDGSSVSSGSSESEAGKSDRASQYTGPQMDAFNAALAAGMAGINTGFGGIDGARNSAMDTGDRDALMAGYNTGVGALNRANEGYYDPATDQYVAGGRDIPGMMANQALMGLLALGQQGYDSSGRGMNQYYNNARYTLANSPQSQAMGLLSQGYGDANNILGGLAGNMQSGFGETNRNIGDVRGDITRGADTTRGDVQGLYDDSIGSWMGGNYESEGRLGGLIPRFDRTLPLQEDARKYSDLGWTFDYDTRNWVSPDGRTRRSGVPLTRPTFAYQNV